MGKMTGYKGVLLYTKYAKIRTKIRKQTYRGSIFCEKGGTNYGKEG